MFFSIVGLGIIAMTISAVRCDVKDMWEERGYGMRKENAVVQTDFKKKKEMQRFSFMAEPREG